MTNRTLLEYCRALPDILRHRYATQEGGERDRYEEYFHTSLLRFGWIPAVSVSKLYQANYTAGKWVPLFAGPTGGVFEYSTFQIGAKGCRLGGRSSRLARHW
jgi:hypothetical protein